jgi:hypothetical protein
MPDGLTSEEKAELSRLRRAPLTGGSIFI